MTVKELKEELDFYDDDMEVEFNVDDRVIGKLIPSCIGQVNESVCIELEVSRE